MSRVIAIVRIAMLTSRMVVIVFIVPCVCMCSETYCHGYTIS